MRKGLTFLVFRTTLLGAIVGLARHAAPRVTTWEGDKMARTEPGTSLWNIKEGQT
jgi:hypothetical protein